MAVKKAETKVEAAPAAGTAVAQAAPAAVATLQSTMLTDAAGGASGFEEADSTAYAIPFLQILQSGSPQCKRSEGAYIPGAKEGMFYNTVTQELFEGEDILAEGDTPAKAGGVILIPAHYTQRFIEWKLRDEGGGFVAEHKPTDPIVLTTVKDEENRDRLPNGNVLVDTRNHYVLLVKPDGQFEPIVVSMSSTQLKKSRNWMSKMQGLKIKDVNGKFVTAPMASHMYMDKTIPEKNDKGAWMGHMVTMKGPVTDPNLYQAAQEFRAAVIKGAAKATIPTKDVSEGAAGAENNNTY